jgi:hypothetical protein
MNLKLILMGALAFLVVTWALGMGVSGPVLHEGILKDVYMSTSSFWRPELQTDPPNMAALMPRWLTMGVISALIIAGVYGAVRSSFTGPGWKRGLKYGFMLFLLNASLLGGWSGVFNLPDTLWAWWCLEALVMNLAGGLALGWVSDLKFVSGESAARAAA